ncbi:MAG: right-handed parallel beta-helix repeat-containing protein, partial [Ignavibacteriales bacterium]|nr:right-handed parallel beta-helix repeat-containing protein [Ignavibacteriales bacterium]
MIPWTQMADPRLRYKMRLYIRVEDNDTSVLRNAIWVHAGLFDETPINQPTFEKRRNFFTEPPEIPLESVGITQTFTNRQLPESSEYYWIETNYFNVTQDMNLAFHVSWAGNLTLYLDKVVFVSQEFDSLYVRSDSTLMTAIKSELSSVYTTTIINHDRFQSFYFDEPFQLSAEYRKDLQTEIFSKATSNNNLELNGATGGVPGYFLHFDINWASPTSTRLKNYLLYNLYPIGSGTTYSQDHVQSMLNTFVNYHNFDEGGDGPYQYSGLRSAQLAAQRYNTNEIDDIPLVMTLGVHSEQYVVVSGGSPHVVPGPHSRRAPTYDEIMAQGNLALAYGAKGFMYYMIPTRTGAGVAGDTSWNTYGLFDDSAAVYDSSNSGAGLVQDPSHNQVPNHRYRAVKDFISSISLIDTVFLGLKWINGKSWHLAYTGPTPWLDNVVTKYPGFQSDDITPYVETGEFVEFGETAEDADERYVYLVNRRCNKQSTSSGDDYSDRYITFKVTRFKDYVNYKITNLKNNDVYFRTYNQTMSIYLAAGGGTLLKIEPVVHSGGTLIESETVKHQVDVKSDLILTSGKTLTITNGADMRFLNSSQLDVSSATLYIFTTNSSIAKLDFVTRDWTAGNGIVAGGANVSINNAIISNGSAGISAWNPASLSISNTTIENCWFGVAVQSRPIGSIYLDNVKVLNCDARGVTLDNANLEIKNSRISGSDYGIRIVNGMVFRGDYNAWYQYGLDTLSYNSCGLYSYDSDVNFGFYDEPDFQGINNLFSENSTNIVAWEGSEISAQHNFWDDISDLRIEVDLKSNVYTSPELEEGSDNPLEGDESDQKANTGKFANGEGSTVKEKIGIIRGLIKSGKPKLARVLCVNILENNSDDELVPLALRLFKRTFNGEEIVDYKAFLKHGNNTRKGTIAKGLLQVQNALFEGNPIVYLDSIASEYTKKFPA